MPVKMKDIAERAGVSLSTVSVVLSGSRRLAISDETRRNILAIASDLKYTPNPYARSLARGDSNLFGVVISEIANPFFPEMIRSFESAAAAQDKEILLFNTEYDPERARVAVSKMIANNVCGAAVFTSKFDPSLVQELRDRNIPSVLVQSKASAPGISTIDVDFSSGIAQAIDHLLGLGHRNFGAITGPKDIPSAQAFTANLAKLTNQLGLNVGRVVSCNYRHDGGMRAVRSMFRESNFPTAILCASDLIALGAISELESAGLSVPQDVSVVGFDDLVFAHLSRPPLTTVAVARTEIGKLAFQLLTEMQNGKDGKGQSRSLRPRLVIRGSTAVPPNPAARQKHSVRRRDSH